MEVRVYKTQSDYSARKSAICQRVADSDISFPYESCVLAFRALYGVNCVVEFVVL